MSFYEQLSKYYDYIFPVGEQQLRFISHVMGVPPKKLLDVACGTGGYSIELAKQGYDMTAVDLDGIMVEKAAQKCKEWGLGIEVQKCDMRELQATLRDKYDGIFCIGNSIVHLGNIKEITDVLGQMEAMLEDSGVLVLQIINYDRVLKYGIDQLPAITNEEINLEFIRKYGYLESSGLISFDTTLYVEEGGQKKEYRNSIELLPVLSRDMGTALKQAGFNKFEFYGDFNKSIFNEESYMLVVEASK